MLKVKDKYDYRRELVEALRSGKYKQCKGNYTNKEGALCFYGVFYHINGMDLKRHHELMTNTDSSDLELELIEINMFSNRMIELNKKLELFDCDYACLNDIDKLTFKQLADRLENEK